MTTVAYRKAHFCLLLGFFLEPILVEFPRTQQEQLNLVSLSLIVSLTRFH